ncbi:DNA methyltransferase [Streptomyces albogriseolus]|uniref:DNA methyltransferase n=1 Tax=Streptomyces albogriseolus TaxID=1887 RepID=UPI00384F3680
MATKTGDGEWRNKLYYGDNLGLLKEHIPTASVDLVYLDPPFNSARSYNVLFKQKSGEESQAQIEAFDDTWNWSHETEILFAELANGSASNKVKDALEAMRKLLGENDVLAYLVMMTARLIELHRVLKPTGSLFLHCDPTASHYLKIVLDAIFGPTMFRNEIVWKRSGAHGSAKRYGPLHDVIFFYTKSDTYTWNQQYGPYESSYLQEKFGKQDPDGRRFQDIALTGPGVRSGESGKPWRGYDPTAAGRHWALPSYLVEKGIIAAAKSTIERLDALDEAGMIYWTRNNTPRLKFYTEHAQGMPQQDVWTDIAPINSRAVERLGYPTQKPISLLERIIYSSSNEGDIVLDPFCGCGTSIDAAQKLGRRWIGMDITTIAVDLIDARLRHTRGESITQTYEILGTPKDMAGAQRLFKTSPFEFERWCVMQVDGQPNEKQVGDKGIDGVIRILLDNKGASDRVLVSVKGGTTNPGHVRDLIGTVASQNAAMGVFISMKQPTKAMIEAANHSGVYTHPGDGKRYPKVQLVTVEELIAGKKLNLPPTLLPYFQAKRRYDDDFEKVALF